MYGHRFEEKQLLFQYIVLVCPNVYAEREREVRGGGGECVYLEMV